MSDYLRLFRDTFSGTLNWLWGEILHPHWSNYFYWLIGLSLFFLALEQLFPWRKNQARIRKDFWLDTFYMFFNFFLFSAMGFAAITTVVSALFNDGLKGLFGFDLPGIISVASWPAWLQAVVMFLLKDFISWATHILLHRVNFLWEFHKVHHSVEQMGFAAHLRFHWMESVVYKTTQYLPLTLIGFHREEHLMWFFMMDQVSIFIGHWNHANFTLPLGPLKYLFNNPEMHIWHHAKHLPKERRFGVNFGISLSLWDYLFKTDYIPSNGRDIELGFPGMENFPKDFLRQETYMGKPSRAEDQ